MSGCSDMVLEVVVVVDVAVVVVVIEVAATVVAESSSIDSSACSAVLFSPQTDRPGPRPLATVWSVVGAGKAEIAGSVSGGADWRVAGVQVWEGAQHVCM